VSLFGGRGGGEDPAARARREESERSLAAGGLPLDAVDRLGEQASRQGTASHFFTSDLSVAELGLLDQEGYEPLGQVMGSSVYHVGWQWMPTASWSSGELRVLTEANAAARQLALGRLQQEAALLSASGVAGVRLTSRRYAWGEALVEFTAIGTAIREKGRRPETRRGQPPFLSDLSGQELWLLRRAGCRPVGFAAGNCTYYQVPNWQTRSATTGGLFGGGWQNQELPDYTRALNEARHRAIGRMHDEAARLTASGVVGVHLELEVTPREVERNDRSRLDMLYQITALGTAIRTERAPTPAVGAVVTLR